MQKWLKQRRKLCDEATDGPWVWEKGREKEAANVMYVEPHSDGSGFGQYDLISRDSGVYGPDVKTCEYIMSHDPATMRLIYNVIEAATAYNVDLCVFSDSGCGQCSQCLLHAAFKKLEAIDD